MKKFTKNWLRFYSKLIVLLLSIIGFLSSCIHSGSKYGPPPNIAEYGAPHATFILKGTILSQKDNSSISHILVKQGTDSVYTDSEGKFTIEKISAPGENVLKILIEDTDGKDHGAFKPLEMDIEFKDIAFTGGHGNWDFGQATKEIEIKLIPE